MQVVFHHLPGLPPWLLGTAYAGFCFKTPFFITHTQRETWWMMFSLISNMQTLRFIKVGTSYAGLVSHREQSVNLTKKAKYCRSVCNIWIRLTQQVHKNVETFPVCYFVLFLFWCCTFENRKKHFNITVERHQKNKRKMWSIDVNSCCRGLCWWRLSVHRRCVWVVNAETNQFHFQTIFNTLALDFFLIFSFKYTTFIRFCWTVFFLPHFGFPSLAF